MCNLLFNSVQNKIMMKDVVVISSESHELALDTAGNPIIEDNQVLLVEKSSGSSLFVPITNELKEVFNLAVDNVKIEESMEVLEPPTGPYKDPGKTPYKWNKTATERLLNLYIANLESFTSNDLKRDVAFAKIGSIMRSEGFKYTSFQCRDRYKYLKKMYIKSKNKGNAEQRFPFYKYFENIKQSSSESHKKSLSYSAANIEEVMLTEEEEESQREGLEADAAANDAGDIFVPSPSSPRKRKYSTDELSEDPEERRHRELIGVIREGIDVFKTMMTELINKLDK